jgi:hypothetical protein
MSKKKPDPAPESPAEAAAPASTDPTELPPQPSADDGVAPEPPAPEPDPIPEVEPLRTDGPTLEEFVAAGYKPEHYPPPGYAARADERVRYFKVLRVAKYCANGAVYTLSEGTVISTAHYDLADVRAQGVPLEETSADQVPGPRTLVQ